MSFDVASLVGTWLVGSPGQPPRWVARVTADGVQAERLEGGRPQRLGFEIVTAAPGQLGVLAISGQASLPARVVLIGDGPRAAWLAVDGRRDLAEARRAGAVPEALRGRWTMRRFDHEDARDEVELTGDTIAFVRGDERDEHPVHAISDGEGVCDLVAARAGRDPVALRLVAASDGRWWAVEGDGARGYEFAPVAEPVVPAQQERP